MIEKIKKILNSFNELSGWTISEEKSSSKEVFMIKDFIDMNRACVTNEFSVRVFVDFEVDGVKYKGDSEANFGISDSEEEIMEKIKTAIFSASFVKNKWYDLPNDKNEEPLKIKAYKTIDNFNDNFSEIQKIIYKDYGFKAKVNSCELFATEITKRVVTSKGVDVTYDSNRFTFEIVTDSNEGKEPVEIFNGYYLTDVKKEEIEKIIKKQLEETDGRSQAVRCKEMHNVRVLLSDYAVDEFFDFYISQVSGSMIYKKISRAEIGKMFQKEDAKNLITIKMNPVLETSIHSRPIDAEGKILKPLTIIKDGKVENIVTGSRFAQYLNVEPTGSMNTYEVSGGKKDLSEYTNESYLEILAFSSFIMDSATGDFGGEFRLAKLVENGKVSYVSGGAITENVFDIQDKMEITKDTCIRQHSITPKAIILNNINVTGD